MNKYLHLGSLVAALSVGCAANNAVEPVKDNSTKKATENPADGEIWPYLCDQVDLKDGIYDVGTSKVPALYLVRGKATECGFFQAGPNENLNALYLDSGCDNTLDFFYGKEFRLSREDVAKETDVAIFDQVLKLAQAFVCNENRLNLDFKFPGMPASLTDLRYENE